METKEKKDWKAPTKWKTNIQLRGVKKIHAPDGVYSILGNHDYGSYYHWQSPKAEIANLDYLVRQQQAMGWKLLNTSMTSFTIMVTA